MRKIREVTSDSGDTRLIDIQTEKPIMCWRDSARICGPACAAYDNAGEQQQVKIVSIPRKSKFLAFFVGEYTPEVQTYTFHGVSCSALPEGYQLIGEHSTIFEPQVELVCSGQSSERIGDDK